MSKTSIKRYLMLLGAIGLVAVASGGAGTFASFNAEVTNSGNSFATGTLILNDNGGTNTCTSAITGTNQNSSGSNCDTLFTTPSHIQAPRAVLTTALATSPNTTSLLFTAGLLNAGIDTGDTLTVTDPTNTCPTPQTFTATQSVPAGAANTSVTVTSVAATCAFPSGSVVTDANATYYADLTLTNAGSIDAGDIKFQSSSHLCSDAAQEPTEHALSSGLTLNNTITQLPVASVTGGVPGGFADGDPIVITSGGNAQTFIVNGAQSASTILTNGYITVQSQRVNFSYPSSTAIGGPSFTGTAVDLCSNFLLSVQEMTSSTFATPQSVCAYPTSGSACVLSSGTALTALPNSFTALRLANATFGHGTSDFFRLALKLPVSTLTNADQNKATPSFGLTWHIDQA